jgi:enoyl-CoA hydratase/carnithine racemase
MIVASEKAVFGLPEPKVGLIAIGGGIHRLVRQVGIKQAMGPLLTGANISAEDGYRMGFVSRLAAPETLDDTVAEICAQILANAPLAVRLSKELGQTGHPSFQRWRQSEDARKGPKAFVEKRPQNWKGR